MAEKKEDKKAQAKKGKSKKKSKSGLYEMKGESIVRKNKFCPKCGAGVFMAKHKDRNACGKCGYAEWNEK
jgi:small subunit ribosomal protein S27Ae